MIRIVDCGSQLTQNIARRVRELGVFSEIVPFSTPSEQVLTSGLEGIIISGGQFSVYDNGSPLYSRKLLEAGVPVLGICYGQQSIAHLLGGKVTPTKDREYGQTRVRLVKPSPLLNEISIYGCKVWMSHGDIVERVPFGFEVTAVSENGHVAAMENGKGVYAVQFHPEVDHTEHGREILSNFLNICKAVRDWNPEKDYDRIVAETEEQVRGKVGVGGISGGVDSSTVSVLVGKIAGRDYHPIFVDNGVLRLNEAEQVRASLAPLIGIDFVDASARFLEKLAGVTNPDEKRKRIGHEFIAVFEEEARKIPGASYLVQGTLYPDVIESVPVYGSSSKIKRHHNVGGLPEKMNLQVVEPFRRLFKDEVRKIAETRLGIPEDVVWRHPFPGPGLAIRILGDVTNEKLRVTREADDIFISELRERGLYRKIAQAFAGILGMSVGVMGDEGTYQYIVGLRAVTTSDFMTADWYKFGHEDLESISNRIINQVRGVNRVVYDTSQKPPSTIEWE